MPLYDYRCPECGVIEDVWAEIEENNLNCPNCQEIMVRLISASNIICDLEPYFDENLGDPQKSPQGQYVQSRQDRKRKMKELGLMEIG
jgi:putative FmdB family regulatory protein